MEDPKKVAEELSRAYAELFGERLRSALLYGSVARGEAIGGVSDINVLLLLDRLDPATLRAASPLARRWSGAGNAAPLFMTWDEWQSASDVFGIELADMRDAHIMLHGSDPLAGLEVERRALRLQAERELRGKLLQLREGLLLAATDGKEIGRLLAVALPSFVTYLRAALRLAGRAVPIRTAAVIEEATALVNAPGDAFLEVARARSEGKALDLAVESPVVDGYFALAEQTARFVDSLSEDDA